MDQNREVIATQGRQPQWLPAVLWLRRSKNAVSSSTGSTLLILTGVFVVILGLIQFSTPNLPGNDGYYHIKLASIMRTEGLKPDFPWLPLTILNPREFYDHHFLYHVFLIPFTLIDLRVGAKAATVIFTSLAFLSVWRLLDKQRIPYAPLWSIGLLAVSEAFIFRMSIPRAQSLSLALLVIGVHWLLTGKHSRLLPLGFIFVWLYNAFPLLFGVAGVYVLGVWLTERRLDVRPLIYGGAGIAIGLIINPYFPYNIVFAFQHIFPKVMGPTAVNVGIEWYPYNTGQLLSNSPLSLLAFVSGALALGLTGRRMEVRTATAFLLACLFGLMLFQSRRFIEYFPPFALIFTAFAWAPLIARSADQDYRDGQNDRRFSPAWMKRWFPAAILLIFLVPGLWVTGQTSATNLQSATPYERYAGSSAWLESSTPLGARVFQTDWDDFPLLFFHNTHNTYLVGLDPTYLQLYDAELYDLWVEITQGKVENPSTAISANFGSFYVLTDHHHRDFLAQAQNDPHLVEVYRDADAVIFQVSATDSNENQAGDLR